MDIIQNFEVPELIILLGAGLAVLLFGYRIKKIAFFVIWFLLGFFGVNYLMPTMEQMWPELLSEELWRNLFPIGGGILLALLGFSIEKLCVSGICFALVILVAVQYFGTEMQVLAIAAVVGVIAAGVAVMMMKPATIVATAAAGAYALTVALLALIPDMDQAVYYWPMIIGFAVLGAIFQFFTTKRVS